jgi:hypothetical protein
VVARAKLVDRSELAPIENVCVGPPTPFTLGSSSKRLAPDSRLVPGKSLSNRYVSLIVFRVAIHKNKTR